MIESITLGEVVKFIEVICSIGVGVGVIAAIVRFLDRDKKQSEKLQTIQNEQAILCYGLVACLKGLKEQGCNGPVTDALDKLEKHLNKLAHGEE